MSGESSYFKLGLFLIIGLALLVAGVVVLGVGAMFIEYVPIETSTIESVQGLDVGAQVKYQGVTVGKVTRIDLAIWKHTSQDADERAVIRKFVIIGFELRKSMLPLQNPLALREGLERAVADGLRVRMGSSGLTGPAYLELTNLDPHTYPPPKLPWTSTALYIPAAPSVMGQIVAGVDGILLEIKKMELAKLATDMDRLVNNTDTAITDLKTGLLRERAVALIDETQGAVRRVRAILDDPSVDQALKDMSATVASLKTMVGGEDVRAFVADLPKISSRLRTTTDRLDEILHDPKLQKTLDGLSVTASNAGPATEELRRALREINLLLTTQQQDVAAIVTNLRRVLENSAALTEDAKSNPSRVIFGEPPPRIETGGVK